MTTTRPLPPSHSQPSRVPPEDPSTSPPSSSSSSVRPAAPRPRRSAVNEEDRTPCPECEMTFSRPEHQHRHYLAVHGPRTEQNGQQHLCEICHKSYSRKDALQRHQQVHSLPRQTSMDGSDGQESPRRPLAKLRRACERCSRMKIRCDGQRPCQRCALKLALASVCELEDQPPPPAPTQARHPQQRQHEGQSHSFPRPWPDQSAGLQRAQQGETSRGSNLDCNSPPRAYQRTSGAVSDDEVGPAARQRPPPTSILRNAGQQDARGSLQAATGVRDTHGHYRSIDSTAAVSQRDSQTRTLHPPFPSESRLPSNEQGTQALSSQHQSRQGSANDRGLDEASLATLAGSHAPFDRSLDHPLSSDYSGQDHTSYASAYQPGTSASVAFNDDIEMISASNPTPASEYNFSAMTPSQLFQPQDFSNHHGGDDVLQMSDLEWLFTSPGPLPSAGLDDLTDPFNFALFGHYEASRPAGATQASVPEQWPPAPLPVPSTGSIGAPADALLNMLAGAATETATADGDAGPPGASIPSSSSGRRRRESDEPVSRAVSQDPVSRRPSHAASSFPSPRIGFPAYQSVPLGFSGQQVKRRRILEPQDLTAPSRRASPNRSLPPTTMPPPTLAESNRSVRSSGEPDGLEASNDHEEGPGQKTQAWPNSWYPEQGTSQPKLRNSARHAINATPEIIAEESSCQVPPIDASSALKLHGLADYVARSVHDDEQPVRSILKSIDVDTYNIMLQLFFEKFQPFYCFLHQPSFNPATAHPLLLAACCAIGCSYSRMPHAQSLAEYLMHHVHLAISISCNEENLHARSLSIIQALLLVGIFFGSSGSQRLLEYSEAQRSALATMVRRCHLLENHPPPKAGEKERERSLQEQWSAWVSWEAIKRTSWACICSDLEFSLAWNVPPVYGLEELKAGLPSSDRRWNASTAALWKSLRVEPTITLPEAHQRYQDARAAEAAGHQPEQQLLPTSSPLVAKIVGCSFQLYSFNLRAFGQHSLMGNVLKEPLDTLQTLLVSAAEAAAADKLKARTPSGTSDADDDIAAVAFELLTHFAHLSLITDLTDLQRLGGRKGGTHAAAALQKIHTHRVNAPQTADLVATSCGRIIHLVRHNPCVLVYSANIFFYASLYLYAFSRSLQRSISDRQASRSVEEGSIGWADESGAVSRPGAVVLDGAQYKPSLLKPGSTSSLTDPQSGSRRFQLRFIGDLAAVSAPLKILKTYSTFLLQDLSERTAGASAKIFGRVLADLAATIDRQQKQQLLQQQQQQPPQGQGSRSANDSLEMRSRGYVQPQNRT